MASFTIVGIDSAKEASELVLGQLPVNCITKVVVILLNEPQPTVLTNHADIRSFFEKNQALPAAYRKDYDCFAMLPGAGGKLYSTVMVYTEGEPDGYTLVVDLDQHASEALPFGGRFTAGPFETMEAAEEFAVKLLVREGLAIETNQEEGDVCWTLRADLDPEQEVFSHRVYLIEAWQDYLEGMEWFHIFPRLKVPTQPEAEPLLSNGFIEQL